MTVRSASGKQGGRKEHAQHLAVFGLGHEHAETIEGMGDLFAFVAEE